MKARGAAAARGMYDHYFVEARVRICFLKKGETLSLKCENGIGKGV